MAGRTRLRPARKSRGVARLSFQSLPCACPLGRRRTLGIGGVQSNHHRLLLAGGRVRGRGKASCTQGHKFIRKGRSRQPIAVKGRTVPRQQRRIGVFDPFHHGCLQPQRFRLNARRPDVRREVMSRHSDHLAASDGTRQPRRDLVVTHEPRRFVFKHRRVLTAESDPGGDRYLQD